VGLLNVDGYYNTFLSFIDKAVEEGFISPTARHIIVSAPTPKELVKEMEVIVTSFFLMIQRNVIFLQFLRTFGDLVGILPTT